MKNTSISLFRQILDLVPKHEFEKIIMKHNGDKHKQTFDCWAHFVSMIFCSNIVHNCIYSDIPFFASRISIYP